MDRLAYTAKLRGENMKAAKIKKAVARKKRIMDRNQARGKFSSEENSFDAKMRSVFCAIRAHTNTDVEFNSSMSPSELFAAVTTALNDPSTEHAAKESIFVSGALELVEKLNGMLATR